MRRWQTSPSKPRPRVRMIQDTQGVYCKGDGLTMLGESMSVLERLFGRGNVTYHVAVAEALDSIAAAILAEQIAFWQAQSEDGWAFRTQEQIQEYTGMKRDARDGARKRLKQRGVLEEKLEGVPARLFYRLDLDALEGLVQETQVVENQQTRMRETSKQGSGKPALYIEGGREREVESSEEDGKPSAADFVAQLDERLQGKVPPLTQARKARLGREFKDFLGKEMEPRVLDEAVDRIVERWDQFQLTVDQAVLDNANGVRSKKELRPEQGVTSVWRASQYARIYGGEEEFYGEHIAAGKSHRDILEEAHRRDRKENAPTPEERAEAEEIARRMKGGGFGGLVGSMS